MRGRALWVLVLAGVGFAISAIFSGWLHLGRDGVVLLYLLIAGPVITAFFLVTSAPLRTHLRRHWLRGTLAGAAVGAMLALSLMQQPPSQAPSGLHLAFALVWLGLVYGLLDGLLLTVAPVLAVYGGAGPGLSGTGRVRRAAPALVASLLVTGAYHLGYQEFRGPQLRQPLIGNTVLTAGYLLTGSLATPLLGHVVMHSAAVFHGMETTSQLPPHYRNSE